jgi:hypothetical protein
LAAAFFTAAFLVVAISKLCSLIQRISLKSALLGSILFT